MWCGFPQILRIVLYEIATIMLDYDKFWTRWFPKMLKGAHKVQRIASTLTFALDIYHKDCNDFSITLMSNRLLNLGFISEYWSQKSAKAANFDHSNICD
jgi:hypothetical protein